MAQLHEVPITDRESMLIGFAKAFGRYPPRPPIPTWWDAFEAFYQKMRAEDDDRPLMLRTEPFEYMDDEDEDDL
jgi:hypothetical protein